MDNNGATRWPGVFWVPMRWKMGKQGPRERASDGARRFQGHDASGKMDPCARLSVAGGLREIRKREDTVEEERGRARGKSDEKRRGKIASEGKEGY